MEQKFEKKNEIFENEIFENKIFMNKIDLTCELIVSHAFKCKDIEYELYILSMNSVSGLCLYLRDTALYLAAI